MSRFNGSKCVGCLVRDSKDCSLTIPFDSGNIYCSRYKEEDNKDSVSVACLMCVHHTKDTCLASVIEIAGIDYSFCSLEIYHRDHELFAIREHGVVLLY